MSADKKLFKNSILTIFIVSFLELLYYMTNCSYIAIIILGMAYELIMCSRYIKNRLIFSPIIFSDFFTICLFLYQLKLIKSYSDLPIKAVVCILLCSFLWKIINLYSSFTVSELKDNKKFDFNISKNKFKSYLFVVFLIAVFFMLLEWYKAGGIPALRSDAEVFRFKVKINGITHMMAIMNKIVAILAATYLICTENRNSKDIFVTVIFIISTSLIYLTAMRSELVIIVFVVAILICIKHKVNLIKLLYILLPILLFVAIFPIYRKYGIYGTLYIDDQKAISSYPSLWFLSPMYQTLCDSIGVFGKVTKMFPKSFPYGILQYSFLSQIPFVDIGKNVSVDIGVYTGKSFYSGLTSTYLGDCYADGGLISCLFYTAIMAIWARDVFCKFVHKRNLKYTILYAFMFYNILMLAYGNTIIELSFVFYYFVISFLCDLLNKSKI